MTRLALAAAILAVLAAPALAQQDDDWGTPRGPARPGGGLGARMRQTAARALPAGFEAVRPEAGSGEAILAKRPGARSAKALLAEALDGLAGYLGGRPRVLGAVSDGRDGAVEARFEVGGESGVALCYAGPNGYVAIVHDRSADLPRTLPALAQLVAARVPQAAPKQVEWQTQQIPDGSGTLRLPAGWTMSATKAMVSASGPQGVVDLGVWCPVMTPEAAAQMFAKPPLVAHYADPETTLRELFPQIMPPLYPGARYLRTIDKAPAEFPNGQAQYIHFQWEMRIDNVPTSCDTVALVIIAPTGGGQFMYYTSDVGCASAAFAENLPILLEIWRSWKVADHVYQERLNHAMQTMRETGEIIRETNENRQRATMIAAEKWDEVIRGEQTVRDAQGLHPDRQVPLYNLDKAIEERNREEGWQRWRVVPVEELYR